MVDSFMFGTVTYSDLSSYVLLLIVVTFVTDIQPSLSIFNRRLSPPPPPPPPPPPRHGTVLYVEPFQPQLSNKSLNCRNYFLVLVSRHFIVTITSSPMDIEGSFAGGKAARA
jgi:hypothetical protein